MSDEMYFEDFKKSIKIALKDLDALCKKITYEDRKYASEWMKDLEDRMDERARTL